MRKLDLIILFIISLFIALIISCLQPVPGYIDADYYFANGTQLVNGNGFSEPFIWNFLDKPQGIPHQSNGYWYPLASIIAAAGMFLTGKDDFFSARIFFILLASITPLVVYQLSFRLSGKRYFALLSGVLAVFSGFYLPFVVTTDNYSLYLLIGGLVFILLDDLTLFKAFLLGLSAGLLNLARGDGIFWLPLSILGVGLISCNMQKSDKSHRYLRYFTFASMLVLAGYGLVMGWWMIRNLQVYGAVVPPGAGYTIWMTRYNQIFSFFPEQNTLQTWLASGWKVIFTNRWEAIWQNVGTAIFGQGMIVLFPFVLAGIWKKRKNPLVQTGVIGWMILLLSESIIFPFASVSGGFFHAGTAFQALWFALVPLGIEFIISAIQKERGKLKITINFVFVFLTIIAIALSSYLVKVRVIDSGWNEGEYFYEKVDAYLEEQGAKSNDLVMVRNPPAYYIMTGRSAVIVPYDDIATLYMAAEKYNVRYIVLEKIGTPAQLIDLYNQPEKYPEFVYLGSIDENHIYSINPSYGTAIK